MKSYCFLLLILFFLGSCAVQKNYNPTKKFSPQELQKDYELFRNILEESHPSLYWHTPKDSIDHYFETGASRLKDSLLEFQFRNILSYVVAQIRCGHTSVRASKGASKYAERTRGISFPLSVKMWDDTTIVTSNLNRRDSNVKRGVLLKSIEGRPMRSITDSFFKFLASDGYNTTHKFQSLSNGGVFRNMYGSIYGLRQRMNVEFIDTAGRVRTAVMNMFVPARDTTPRAKPPAGGPSKRERKLATLQSQRNLRVDKALGTAYMEINTFGKRNRLRCFFKESFKQLRRDKIQNLIVDVRGNGGGSVVLSNLLTKYIANRHFKISDSLYAVNNKSRYRRYIDNYLPVRLFFIFMTRKKSDGNYHFTHFENRYFKPKRKNNFNGTTYILTGGNTFSAATLFTKALKDQQDVVVVGEETGGGAYGNTAWLIPDVTLPHTRVRFRLPLFRLVVDKNEEKGRGILPEVEVKPTVEAIRRNADYKLEKTLQLIKEKTKQ